MAETRVIYGFHAVASRLKQRPEGIIAIEIDAGRRDPRMRELVAAAHARGVALTESGPDRLESLAGTRRHQGVVARVSAADVVLGLEELLAGLAEPALLLVLDGVQDPHNLGACLRVADAFGAHGLVVPKDRAVGLTPAVAKVASGAAETVPLIAVTNLARALDVLKEAGVWTFAAEESAPAPLDRTRLDGPLAFVLGAEGEGLRRLTRERCDEAVRIPMQGSVESLNVSVAAGVCLYEARRQRGSRKG